jgi:UDP-3-O-[3-hydroxymyristoyl] glucosamine N-acyltransferase
MFSSFPLLAKNPLSIRNLVDSLGDCQLYGINLDRTICTVASPESSQDDSLYFIKYSPPHSPTFLNLTAAAVVCNEPIFFSRNIDCCQIVTRDPLAWFISALHILFELDNKPFISCNAVISNQAKLGSNVSIGAGVIIEDHCVIGDSTIIGDNSVIKSGTIIGKNCFIQSNNVIGSIGLGYHFADTGQRLLFPHLGNVIINDNVVIGSSCVIVKGQLKDTFIESDVRVGNLVNIGHNVYIGRNTAISSSCVVAGGTNIGKDCNIAAGVKINAKINIGDSVQIGLGSVVTKTLPGGYSFFGNPAKVLPTMRSF